MIEIGSETALASFRTSHAAFFDGSAVLERALSLAFARAVEASDPLGTVIFFLGSRCADDFRDILLLAANGCGWGATAHLRGMFERCVTAEYLHQNPTAVSDFIDYDYVRRWKVAKEIERAFGSSPDDQPARDELKNRFDAVKQRFMIPQCKQCKTERINHTWSNLDVVSMARQIKRVERMRDLVSLAYYLPLAQAHSTLASILQGVNHVAENLFAVDQKLARSEADRSFRVAHALVLGALDLQREHFDLTELSLPIAEATQHFHRIGGVKQSRN